MLINTVILFLQNALPIFIITCLLLLSLTTKQISEFSPKWLILGLLLTLIAVFKLSEYLEVLSQKFDGKGIELFFSVGVFIMYFASVSLFLLKREYSYSVLKTLLVGLIFLIVSCLHGSYFTVYLKSYWLQTQQVESMLIGIVLGGGICLSISILLYFVLKYADRLISHQTSKIFLLLFAIGQLMHTIVLLQQVDIFPSSKTLWNSSDLISEHSELGQLLTVLFGYETTPSILQLITYTVALIIPVIMSNSTSILLFIRRVKP